MKISSRMTITKKVDSCWGDDIPLLYAPSQAQLRPIEDTFKARVWAILNRLESNNEYESAAHVLGTLLGEFREYPVSIFTAVIRVLENCGKAMHKRILRLCHLLIQMEGTFNEKRSGDGRRCLPFNLALVRYLIRNGYEDEALTQLEQLTPREPYRSDPEFNGLHGVLLYWQWLKAAFHRLRKEGMVCPERDEVVDKTQFIYTTEKGNQLTLPVSTDGFAFNGHEGNTKDNVSRSLLFDRFWSMRTSKENIPELSKLRECKQKLESANECFEKLLSTEREYLLQYSRDEEQDSSAKRHLIPSSADNGESDTAYEALLRAYRYQISRKYLQFPSSVLGTDQVAFIYLQYTKFYLGEYQEAIERAFHCLRRTTAFYQLNDSSSKTEVATETVPLARWIVDALSYLLRTRSVGLTTWKTKKPTRKKSNHVGSNDSSDSSSDGSSDEERSADEQVAYSPVSVLGETIAYLAAAQPHDLQLALRYLELYEADLSERTQIDLLSSLANSLELWTPQLFEEWRTSSTALTMNTVQSIYILWSEFYKHLCNSANSDNALVEAMKGRCRNWASTVLRSPLELARDKSFSCDRTDYIAVISNHCLNTATLLCLRQQSFQ
eukprot:gb/GECG01006366.1/.p1 GENE.gb/GECG01006366.1/~~gb/GECG01006366.1/.p1  ORF type:complete len:609 (+),score=53.05 gb/GECG01006366.1/:1-1827(+)